MSTVFPILQLNLTGQQAYPGFMILTDQGFFISLSYVLLTFQVSHTPISMVKGNPLG